MVATTARADAVAVVDPLLRVEGFKPLAGAHRHPVEVPIPHAGDSIVLVEVMTALADVAEAENRSINHTKTSIRVSGVEEAALEAKPTDRHMAERETGSHE